MSTGQDGRAVSARHLHALVLLVMTTVLAGACRSIGPPSIPRDRFDYSSAITESWKRQTLLNIVKLRYADPPSFVEVSSIVAGYSLETGVTVGGQLSSPGAVQGDSVALGGSGRFTDRPTITYVPMTGNRFMKGLMTPVPPEALFFTIQSGWPADALLSIGVTAINGIRNEMMSLDGYIPPDPRFTRLVELLRQIQLSGAVGLRILEKPDHSSTALVAFHAAQIAPETTAQISELRQLLGLSPTESEFQLVYGGLPANDREIAVLTRSLLHMNQSIAMRAEVPELHVQEGRAVPGLLDALAAGGSGQAALIRCTVDEPESAFVKVLYRGYWFWVDDRDLRAKRALTFMMLLFTLADTGERENLPLVTIPAQ